MLAHKSTTIVASFSFTVLMFLGIIYNSLQSALSEVNRSRFLCLHCVLRQLPSFSSLSSELATDTSAIS